MTPLRTEKRLCRLSGPLLATAMLLLVSCGGRSTGNGEERASAEQSVSLSGQLFVEKGCVKCHTIQGLNLEGGELGPDLTTAYTDVQKRLGMTLEEFLEHPTGTMQIVLSSQIQLTEGERELVSEILRSLDPNTLPDEEEHDESES